MERNAPNQNASLFNIHSNICVFLHVISVLVSFYCGGEMDSY